MNSQDLTELLRLIPNGNEKFQKSPLLNVSVRMLLEGVEPIKIIDNLIHQIEDLQKVLEQNLLAKPISLMIDKNQLNLMQNLDEANQRIMNDIGIPREKFQDPAVDKSSYKH